MNVTDEPKCQSFWSWSRLSGWRTRGWRSSKPIESIMELRRKRSSSRRLSGEAISFAVYTTEKKNQQPLLFLSWLLSSEICVPWLQKRKAQFHPIKLFPGWYCWNPWGWKCGNARTACNPHPLFDGVICKSHSRSTLQAHRYRLSAKVTIMPVLVYMWSPTCLNLGSSHRLRLRVPLAVVR